MENKLNYAFLQYHQSKSQNLLCSILHPEEVRLFRGYHI